MKIDFKIFFFIFLLTGLSFSLEDCPQHCKCDWESKRVSCSGVEVVPFFHGSIEEVLLVRTKLASIPPNTFASLPNISHVYIFEDEAIMSLESCGAGTTYHILKNKFIDLFVFQCSGIINTGLTSFPIVQYIHSRQENVILEMEQNLFIRVIPANSFTGISKNALTLILHGNGLTEIQDYAFNSTQLEEVYLNRNMDLENIAELAFSGVIHGPTHLDLSETKVHSLPSLGMTSIERLQISKTWELKALPPLSAFLHLQNAHVTYASHCCGLRMLERWRREAKFCNLTRAALANQQESFGLLSEKLLGNGLFQRQKNSSLVPTTGGQHYNMNNLGDGCPDKQAQEEGSYVVDLSSEQFGEEFDFALCNDLFRDKGPSCTPLPDALNPCEDVMSQGFLRVLVWVVSFVAISANSFVLFILLTSHQKLSVTRFFLGHLAFADGCMGMYLLFIALVDFYTHSRYYQYAISWQTGRGCNLAGILSVFSSELSVYTLTSISFQRWHAIFNAMRPDRQMRLRHAALLMLLGWLLCGTIASLPVLGVNTYQRVSICLPMDTETAVGQFYIVSVLVINVMAFMAVCLCYLHIYCMVHNPQRDSSRYDTRMAKRMAVLIFTNFLCLAPICFYGLSAVLHQPLMTITDSKVCTFLCNIIQILFLFLKINVNFYISNRCCLYSSIHLILVRTLSFMPS
uniref:Thyrotropin receptor-like n=1 Tax=Cyprinodon variegatus TaxID=28743 RepID=A0A3Q2FEJ1_CYPVA